MEEEPGRRRARGLEPVVPINAASTPLGHRSVSTLSPDHFNIVTPLQPATIHGVRYHRQWQVHYQTTNANRAIDA